MEPPLAEYAYSPVRQTFFPILTHGVSSLYTEMLKYLNMQNRFINIKIFLLENIENDLFYLCIRL